MRIGPWICAALVVLGAWRWYGTRELSQPPGVLAADDPAVSTTQPPASIGTASACARADFSATVRVTREDSLGPLARLVPTDFAVGWGPMSDSAVLAGIEISQGNRFYYWRTQTWPVGRADIERHSANWHLIAADDSVRAVLDGLRAGSLVQLRGRLVDIEGKQGGMRTSLSRSDTGAGACEIVLATSARLMETTQ